MTICIISYLLGVMSTIIPAALITIRAKKKRDKDRNAGYDEFLKF